MADAPATLQEACEEFLLYESSVRNLALNTIAGYRNDLARLCRLLGGASLPLTSVTVTDLRFCIGELSRKKSAASSVNRFIAAVRSLFAYCRRFEYIKSNPATELHTVKQPRHLPRFMTESEVDALCSQPERKTLLWQTRDTAIFEMLYSSGCRVSELASLRLSDFSADFRSAVVTGKGGKDRRVFFSEQAGKALAGYLRERAARIPKNRTVSAVFINMQGTPLTTRGIRYIVSRYSGLEGTDKPVSPHAFRHTFATSMLSHGADVRVVQELLGHSSISTTQRYTHITTEQLIEIYNRAHPHGGSDENG
ncbi:tyrosine-type recombinase/integrase [Treponema brennaborense]|uniref:Tyrosine recombinase XerC n=1 Tax=Treponema brennaborense (strain DSM 12168 / CIP 105900 / DD5/3) TaxID=906968 RepID=F4LJJ9_TREBD|nr:tyrosine-type recombinase/integrase [Treponema brennaborense]AEE16394.1 Tyrosine recombinase xerC [Treponema brennaborense DSM 12168]